MRFTSRTALATALTVTLFLNAVPVVAQGGASAPSPQKAPLANPDDWSKALVESTLQRNPDPSRFGGWGYARSLYLFGQYLVYKRTHDPRYLDYIQKWVDV